MSKKAMKKFNRRCLLPAAQGGGDLSRFVMPSPMMVHGSAQVRQVLPVCLGAEAFHRWGAAVVAHVSV